MAATESSKALISHSRLLINMTVQIRQQLEWNSANVTAQTYMYTAKVLPTSAHHQLKAWPSIGTTYTIFCVCVHKQLHVPGYTVCTCYLACLQLLSQ